MTEVLGVMGGIGCGKSAVSRAFAAAGAVVLDADVIAHDVLGREETVDALRRTFGPGIFHADNTLNRQALALKVFGPDNSEALKSLNAIVHPAVRSELDRRLAEARQAGESLVVLDIPLLLESRFRDECDHIVFVKVSRENRLKRVQSRNWSADELDRRESSQPALALKEEAADLILENDGTLEELEKNVRKLFDQLVAG